jgi:hypothetical protein
MAATDIAVDTVEGMVAGSTEELPSAVPTVEAATARNSFAIFCIPILR